MHDSSQFRVLFRGSGAASTAATAEEPERSETNSDRKHRSTAYFHSVLRFLHIGGSNSEDEGESSTTSNRAASHVREEQPASPMASSSTPNLDDSASRLAATATPPQQSEKPRSRRSHPHLPFSFATSSSSTKRPKKGSQPAKHTHYDPFDLRASIISLECDEDEDREDIIQIYEAISAVLLKEHEQKSKELHSRLIWNAESGKELTEEQSKHLFTLLFLQMRSILVQQFSLIFSPLGLSLLESVTNSKHKPSLRPQDTTVASLAPLDVAACVCALVVLEMAITDDDSHSFAISVYHGQRLSLGNCPKSKRYLYFTFMAFKSTVDSIRSVGVGALDAFRAAISRYFHDRSSIRQLPSAFELPMQALLNVLAPIMMSQHFQGYVKQFYQDALKMEHDRAGGGNLADGRSNSSSEEGREETALGNSWSTIQVGYHKAAGDIIGEGAYGKVYRCYDASNGTFYALKEITLIPKSMFRRIRDRYRRDRQLHPEKYEHVEGDSKPHQSLDSTLNAQQHKITYYLTFLTDDERRELSGRESSIHGEINFLRTLRHPNIVSYYGCTFNREKQLVSLLMEFCPKTLRSIVVDMGRLPLSMIAHYAAQVLQGLHFLHEHHIVHRDIKAANILVKDHGEAKVSDFGTAAVLSTNGNGAETDAPVDNESMDSTPSPLLPQQQQQQPDCTIQGTPLFLAPEVAKGCLPTVASDIWSFGCMLIELATGEYPWHEWTHGQPVPLEMIVFRIGFAQQPPQLDPELAPEAAFDPSFTSLLRSCLQFDPCDRLKAGELLQHEFFQVHLHADDGSSELPRDETFMSLADGPETSMYGSTTRTPTSTLLPSSTSNPLRRRTVVQRGELPLPGGDGAQDEADLLANDSMFTSVPSFSPD